MSPGSDVGFRIERTTAGSMTIIAVFGELDLATKARLSQEVDSVLMTRPVIVAIDLRGLSFMDSSGIHVLVRTAHRCQRRGQRCFLIRGNPAIEQALQASGLAGFFETYDSPDWIDDGEITITAG